ncbi:MAG: alkaline phosphatase family protein [Pedosphaera sp. Tous-C6FEB]|nr:MAG: alkaline phosphatase family protein [Pedosphaera sp. Tous-C6FEB]
MLRRAFLLLALLASLVPGFAAEVPAKDRLVILVTVDGFPASIWDDATLPMPFLQSLAREGAVAKAMKISNPAVTWPNHTTLVTGVSPAKHGVLFNGMMLRQGPDKPLKLEPWKNKNDMVRVPTVYDLAFKAGLKTAQVDWVPTTNAGTFHFEFGERPSAANPIEREMLAAGLITATELAEFNQRNPPWRDVYWTRAGVHIVKQHRPNLLLFHLLNTDAVNHRFGPGNWASYSAYAFADHCLRDLVEAAHAAGFRDKLSLVITTDHGFKTAKRIIRPNVALRQAGLLRVQGPTITTCDAVANTLGGSAMIYVPDPTKRAALTPKLKALLGQLEGVERIFEPSEFPALGLPTPAQNDQMADLFIVAKDGYAFTHYPTGDAPVTDLTPEVYPGHHGYLASDPKLDGAFIAWGHGVKRGAQLGEIRNVDVAPTVAALLGLKMENVEGRVLAEALQRK